MLVENIDGEKIDVQSPSEYRRSDRISEAIRSFFLALSEKPSSRLVDDLAEHDDAHVAFRLVD